MEEIGADSTALISGTCGENLTWIFDEATGTLTIFGTGEMTNYSSSNQPWYSYQASIKEVVIEEGVRQYAFYNCSSLTSITLPKSVTSIGDYAFYGCSSLTSVVIPEGVISIGSSAFSGCSSLISIVIPDNVTSIGDYAFSSCSSLTSVVLPESLTSIGNYAFQKCISLTSIEIPENVITIGNYAFDGCNGIASVVLPAGIQNIGNYAFNGCSKLTDVRYGGSETDRANITIGTYNDPLLNATWHYGLLPDVAMISEKTYTSLAEAITAANDGDVITLIHDVKLSEKLSISGKVTIDLNVHAITADFTGEESVLSVETAGECTLRDSAGNGMIEGKLLNNGKLTIESGTFTDIENNGQLVITDAVVNGSIVNGESGTIAISGGKYTNAVEKAWCAEGYVPSDEAVDGYYGVEKAEEATQTITAKAATLLYNDMIQVRYKFEAVGEGIAEYGMYIFASAEDAASLDATKATQAKTLDKYGDGFYYGYTDGIAAKNMVDTQYVVGYIKLESGEYVYANAVEYSPMIYAQRMVGKDSTDAATKQLCNALMQYGAAAQQKFDYKEDSLMNAGFAAVEYDETVLGESVFKVDTTETNGFTTKAATLLFTRAITYRVRYTASSEIADKALYLEYATKGTTGSVEMQLIDGSYYGYVDGIAPKDMDETIVFKPYYLDENGNKVYGAELVYSGYEYARRTIASTSSTAEDVALSKAFAMYVSAVDAAIA